MMITMDHARRRSGLLAILVIGASGCGVGLSGGTPGHSAATTPDRAASGVPSAPTSGPSQGTDGAFGTGLARQLAVMGNESDADYVSQAWLEWLRAVGASIGATCSEAPIDSQLALRFARQAALLGEDDGLGDFLGCLPSPPPACSDGRVPLGVALAGAWTTAVIPGCGAPGFTGSATYTSHTSLPDGSERTISVTATNVVWEPEAAIGPATTYHAVAGQLIYADQGMAGDCTIEGSGAASIGGTSAATDSLLFVDLSGPQPTYSGFASLQVPITTTTTCANDAFSLDSVTTITWLQIRGDGVGPERLSRAPGKQEPPRTLASAPSRGAGTLGRADTPRLALTTQWAERTIEPAAE